jgi:hypothetical protein
MSEPSASSKGPRVSAVVKVGAASVAVMALFGWTGNGCFHDSTAGSYYDGVGGGGNGGGGGFCAVFDCSGGPNAGAGGAGGSASTPAGGTTGSTGGA